MKLALPESIKNVLVPESFYWACGINKAGRLEPIRGFGIFFDEEAGKVTLLVNANDAGPLLACLQDTGRIAFVMMQPLTSQSIQVKGKYLLHRPATAEEETEVREVNQVMQAEMVTKYWGQPEGAIRKWPWQPALAIEIEYTDIFDQTPRKNTGAKIG